MPLTRPHAFSNCRCCQQHYNTYQTSSYGNTCQQHTGTQGAVRCMTRSTIPQQIGSTSVDTMYSSSDGVWYPDWDPNMAWFGVPEVAASNAGFPSPYPFNPFAGVDHLFLVLAYTEQLAQADSVLQRYMVSCRVGSSLVRGKQSAKQPVWASISV